MTPDLSIIIVNWKSREYVRQCLRSLFTQSQPLSLEVFVVDNASFDGVAEMLLQEFPAVTFVQCERNLGFAGANNLAFEKCTARNVLFLNPDTEIQGAALQTLLTALSSLDKAGMVGCRLLNTDHSLQRTCITAVPSLSNQIFDCALLRRAFPGWNLWGQSALWRKTLQPTKVEAISGACMMARRDVIESIGAFTTEYFMYAEDMDLCLQVDRAGWSIYYVPQATIVHHGGASSTQRESTFSSVVLRASVLRFFQLRRGDWYANCYRLSMTAISLLRIFLLLLLLPLSFARKGAVDALHPLRKWWSILLWSLGLNPAPHEDGIAAPTVNSTALPAA